MRSEKRKDKRQGGRNGRKEKREGIGQRSNPNKVRESSERNQGPGRGERGNPFVSQLFTSIRSQPLSENKKQLTDYRYSISRSRGTGLKGPDTGGRGV